MRDREFDVTNDDLREPHLLVHHWCARGQHLRDRLGANRDRNAVDNLLVREWRNALGRDLRHRRHHVICCTDHHVFLL
jgi:hypothetical protein